MPELTRDDAVPGFMGLLVVLARRNATMPATLKATPTTATAAQAASRKTEGTCNEGVTDAMPHMAAATTTATRGGGTKASSDLMRDFRGT